jgi:hypothetical protein
MSVLSIKYPTDFPFGCQYISGTLNVHHLNIRAIPYLIFYIQRNFILLYKDIRGAYILYSYKPSNASNIILRLRTVSINEP